MGAGGGVMGFAGGKPLYSTTYKLAGFPLCCTSVVHPPCCTSVGGALFVLIPLFGMFFILCVLFTSIDG